MVDYILGMDLGSNSVGWTAIAQDGQTFPGAGRILAGARVFPEGKDNLNQKKEKPRGQDRRFARGQRRTHQRRNHRRKQLCRELIRAGLFPENGNELQAVLQFNPYPLRRKALDKKISPFEFGRVLYHLCQRRGFKSNRKQDKSKEDGKVAKATAELQKEIDDAGCRTLGEYLAAIVPEDGDSSAHRTVELQRARNRYTLRSMYEGEFKALWEAQQQYYPKLLTGELRDKVHNVIFFQRPLSWDKESIGECELEEGEKRCAKAHWYAQQFRMIQEINALRVIDSDGERALSDEERSTLREALTCKKEMTFDKIRQLLGFLDHQKFNLETGGQRKKLKGNEVGAMLQHKLLKQWYKNAEAKLRSKIHEALAEMEDEKELEKLVRDSWGLDDEQVEKLLKIKLPTGRYNLSLKAMKKIMPYLAEGMVFAEAKLAAGYNLCSSVETKQLLPPVDEAVNNLTNPLVHRALSETRKVVNSLIARLGCPKEIVVELARDMKLSKDRRREVFWENVNRRDENEEIRSRLITECNIPSPSRDDVIKYRLWEECNKTCVYTGRTIPKNKLFHTGEVQIEHIFPYSRCLDDSYMNKTLCYADENRSHKGSRTPYEAYGEDAECFDAIQQRIRCLPYPKRRKFTQKEIDLDQFVQRQLNDTRYMSRAAVGYLCILGCDVRSVKGGTTSELRHQWGLNSILNPLAPNQKTRDDHRHHAVDAAVVAMTTRSFLQQLSTIKYNPEKLTLDPPWENFRDDLAEVVNGINVSFRPSRKLAGALHEETYYGPGSGPGKAVYRKPVAELTGNMVEEIRDLAIRKIVKKAIRESGQTLSGSDKLSKILGDTVLRMPSGVPIKKVRLETTEKTLVPIRHDETGRVIKLVKPGGNHHAEIYELPDGTWTGRAVSRFEAHQRLRRGEPVICHNLGDGSKFVMSLCINDMLHITKDGERKLYRVQNTSISSPLLTLRLHTAARTDDKSDPAIKATRHLVATWESFRKLESQKVSVDPLGRIRPCND